jgi:hypothetical protein
VELGTNGIFDARAGQLTVSYQYDALNRLDLVTSTDVYSAGFTSMLAPVSLEERLYDAASREVFSGTPYKLDSNGNAPFDGGTYKNYIQALLGTGNNQSVPGEDVVSYGYDAAGRLQNQTSFDLINGLANVQMDDFTYDAAGNLTGYKTQPPNDPNDPTSPTTSTVTIEDTVEAGFGYKQTLATTSNSSGVTMAAESYDADGNLIAVGASPGTPARTLYNDAAGQVLEKVQGGITTMDLIVNGELRHRRGARQPGAGFRSGVRAA